MLDRLRSTFHRAEELAREGSESARYAASSGLLRELSPRGLVDFGLSLRYLKTGPHLALLFHALNHPDREAVVCGPTRLSYGEHNRQVNQL